MMRFMAKVAIQRLIGAIPGGPALYERARRRRIFDDIDSEVAVKRAVAERYASLLRTVGGVEVGALSSHLEMGSGWLPVLPLTFRRHGVTRQVLTDVAPLMRGEDAVAVAAALDRAAPVGAQPLAPPPGEAADRWLERLGIRYHAPQPLPMPFPDASFDLVTITQVLQYPAPDVIRAIHQEAARLLRPGGWYILSVELADLYHHFDPALPRFNFLRYSEATWRRWFNNPYTPLNRLRATQHRELLAAAPFDILLWETAGGGPDDIAELRRAPPHAAFSHIPEAELARTNLIVLARRR